MTAQSDSVWIDVDIGKTHHHVAAIDTTGRQLWPIRVRNDQHSIKQLLSKATAPRLSLVLRWGLSR